MTSESAPTSSALATIWGAAKPVLVTHLIGRFRWVLSASAWSRDLASSTSVSALPYGSTWNSTILADKSSANFAATAKAAPEPSFKVTGTRMVFEFMTVFS